MLKNSHTPSITFVVVVVVVVGEVTLVIGLINRVVDVRISSLI